MAVSVLEASERILAHAAPLDTEHVSLGDALGRVLAEDVRSPIEHPPWDNSSMDGYAVRSGDVRDASEARPVTLRVIETVAAGQRPTAGVSQGVAIRIMTGAPVPSGADTVIRVEDTDGGDSTVVIRDARDAMRNVRPRGEDLRVGDVAVARGTTLGPAHIGVLASVGAASPLVHRRPIVAILVSGDELVDVDQFDAVQRGDRIVSSNSYTITANVRAAGGEPRYLGIAPDDPNRYRALLDGAKGADLLITSGGVSVGAFDFTKDVLRELGAELALWRVGMRPGAPLGFGMLDGMPWLGLPGNPVSAMVTFELFARPLIRRLRGERAVFARTIEVQATEEITLAAPLMHFMRSIVEWPAGMLPTARLTGPQGSGLLTSMARANALLIVPPDRQIVRAGETLRALPLGESALSREQLDL